MHYWSERIFYFKLFYTASGIALLILFLNPPQAFLNISSFNPSASELLSIQNICGPYCLGYWQSLLMPFLLWPGVLLHDILGWYWVLVLMGFIFLMQHFFLLFEPLLEKHYYALHWVGVALLLLVFGFTHYHASPMLFWFFGTLF